MKQGEPELCRPAALVLASGLVLGGYQTASGKITVNGQEIDLTGKKSDGQSRRARGIAHVPEDRQSEGLIMDYTAWENVVFGYHGDPQFQSGLLVFMEIASVIKYFFTL